MIWIGYRRGEAIPQSMLYPDYQTDRNRIGQTPLMLWRIYREDEPIPEQLRI